MLLVLPRSSESRITRKRPADTRLSTFGLDQVSGEQQPGENMEGKEVRLGIARIALLAALTTGSLTGAANGMHDSLTPLGGLFTLVMMPYGQVILGGVGTGLASRLVFVIIAA